MKRPLTLIGFILSAVSNAIFAIATLIGSIVILSNLQFIGATGEIWLITVASMFIVAFCGFLFNAFCIGAWNKETNIYKALKTRIITSVIINFLPIFYLVFFAINDAEFVIVIWLIVLVVVNLLANVLVLIDLIFKPNLLKTKKNDNEIINNSVLIGEPKERKLIQQQTTEKKQQPPEEVQAVNLNKKELPQEMVKEQTEKKLANKKVEQKSVLKTPLEERLQKLALMKEAEMITEEEYKQIKKKYIMEELSKKL